MPRKSFVESITVQARDCEEIDGLRAQLGLPARQWEPDETRKAQADKADAT